MEIGINYWIGAKVEEEGSVAIPARVLSDFVNNVSDEKLTITTKENNILIKQIEENELLRNKIQHELNELKHLLIIKDEEILNLKEQLKIKNIEILELNKLVSEQNEHINTQNERIKIQDERIKTQTQKINTMEIKINILENLLNKINIDPINAKEVIFSNLLCFLFLSSECGLYLSFMYRFPYH